MVHLNINYKKINLSLKPFVFRHDKEQYDNILNGTIYLDFYV